MNYTKLRKYMKLDQVRGHKPHVDKVPIEHSAVIKERFVGLNPGADVQRAEKSNRSDERLISVKIYADLKAERSGSKTFSSSHCPKKRHQLTLVHWSGAARRSSYSKKQRGLYWSLSSVA